MLFCFKKLHKRVIERNPITVQTVLVNGYVVTLIKYSLYIYIYLLLSKYKLVLYSYFVTNNHYIYKK